MKNFKKVTAGFISLAMLACIGAVQAFATNNSAAPEVTLPKGNAAMKTKVKGSVATGVASCKTTSSTIKTNTSNVLVYTAVASGETTSSTIEKNTPNGLVHTKVDLNKSNAAVVAKDVLEASWEYDNIKAEAADVFTPNDQMTETKIVTHIDKKNAKSYVKAF